MSDTTRPSILHSFYEYDWDYDGMRIVAIYDCDESTKSWYAAAPSDFILVTLKPVDGTCCFKKMIPPEAAFAVG